MKLQSKKLFVLIPFASAFDKVYTLIKDIAKSSGYSCWRADDKCVSGNVVRQITEDISTADAIISDLTGRNPNVFYETAIAHERKKENKVILIAQKDRDVPFDLQALRYLKYSIKDTQSKHTFKEKLRAFLKEAGTDASSSPFEVIEGVNERTRRIIAELNALMVNRPLQGNSISVCSQSALSIFSISKREVDSAKNAEQRLHKELIMEEKKTTIDMIRMGVKYLAILNLPTERAKGFEYLDFRYQEMLKLFDPRTSMFEDILSNKANIEFAISPVRENNLLLVGNSVCFEGRKSGFLSGYAVTTRIADKVILSSLNRAFLNLFKDAKKYTLSKYGMFKKGTQSKNKLKLAIYNGLKESYEKFKAH